MSATERDDSAIRGISVNPKEPVGFLLPVYFVVFSAFFDTHAQMPVLAPYALTLGATPFMIGIVIGSYSIFNIAGNFFGGATIDRKSWKHPLFLGLFGVAVILVLYTRADSAMQLAFIRAGHGFMGGLLVPAALACLTGEEGSRGFLGSRLAYFGATIGLAAITGPLIAGIIANRFGYPAVYYTLAILILIAAIASTIILGNRVICSRDKDSFPISIRQIFFRPNMLGAFLFAFGTMGSTGTLASFLPIRTGAMGLNHAQTGMLFTTFALFAIITQMLWPGKIKPILLENFRGCYLGLIFLCLSLGLAASLNNISGLFGTLVLFGIGFGLSFQGMLGLVIEDAYPVWRGRAIGLFFAVYSLGVALVPPLSGLIWQNFPAVFPFYTAAAAALFSLLAGSYYVRERPEC